MTMLPLVFSRDSPMPYFPLGLFLIINFDFDKEVVQICNLCYLI